MSLSLLCSKNFTLFKSLHLVIAVNPFRIVSYQQMVTINNFYFFINTATLCWMPGRAPSKYKVIFRGLKYKHGMVAVTIVLVFYIVTATYHACTSNLGKWQGWPNGGSGDDFACAVAECIILSQDWILTNSVYLNFVHDADLASKCLSTLHLWRQTTCPISSIQLSIQQGQLLSALSGGSLRGKKRNVLEALAEVRAANNYDNDILDLKHCDDSWISWFSNYIDGDWSWWVDYGLLSF